MTGSQAATYSISQLVFELRRAVEETARRVWVKGEITGLKVQANGNWFFSLRDEESSISCSMWKSNVDKLRAEMREGSQVFALVSATVWPKRGQLSLNVTVMLPPTGVGLQTLSRERVRQALEADGLLDPSRKRALPSYPRTIAVITSPDGAAIHDIITVTRKRWASVRILVVPARVQGDGAPGELCRAVRIANRIPGVDVCIIGRGGGSREDLLAFDDEKVCRAVCELRMPIISAVGHETDLSLTDLVADHRAATPSAAAELAVPDRDDVIRHAQGLATRLAGGLSRRTRLVAERLERTGDRLQSAMVRKVEGPRVRLERLSAQLEALSPLKVLGRGYSVAMLEDGSVAKRTADLPAGRRFTLRVSDGDVPSRVE